MPIYYKHLKLSPNLVFPKGVNLLLLGAENKLCGVYVMGQKNMPNISSAGYQKRPDPLLEAAADQLIAYLSGDIKRFTLPYRLHGSLFQKKIWQQLSTIPYGTQISYKALANSFDAKQPIRPLAHAVAKNPLLFLLPCHRVVGSDGSLKGFSAGLPTKRRLLNLERDRSTFV